MAKQKARPPAKRGGKSAAAKYGAVGVDDVNIKDINPSFIKMVQPTSSVQSASQGELIDSVTEEPFGNEIFVIPIKKYIDWVKFNENFELEDRSIDGLTWVNSGRELDKDEKWRDKRINFFVFVDGFESELPYILTFGKTSFGAGKKMADTIEKNIYAKKEPIFARKFRVFTEQTQNAQKKKYYVLKTELMQDEPSDAEMDQANEAHGMINKMLEDNKQRLLEAPQADPGTAATSTRKRAKGKAPGRRY